MFLIVYYLIVSALAATCTTAQANCANEKCETVGSKEICTECKTGGNVPIDGTCTKIGDATNKCKKANDGNLDNTDKTCGKCEGATFMFKGGCYSKDTMPGNTMCKTAVNGVCTVVADGSKYFLPPTGEADNLHQSVIPCGDDSVVTVKDNKQYKGVAHCTQCGAPDAATDTTNAKAAKCTACENGYFVESAACTKCHESCLTCEGAGADKCKSCTPETYFLGAAEGSQGKCVSCGDASGSTWKGVDGCLKCTKSNSESTPATCTECQAERYLKEGPPVSCVTAETCNTGYFPNDSVDGKKKCLPCSDGTNGGIAKCSACSLLSSTAEGSTVRITCSACSSDNLSPLKNECMASCPAGTYAKDNICTPCHTSCSSCSDAGESSCTACYPGSVLNHGSTAGKGTCIAECTGRYAENCADGQCTASIAGSKYCSRCKSGFVPVDGLCVSATARAPNGCTPSTTTAGTCESCKDAYFLESGGCYQAAVYPGNMLCTTTDNNGKCTKCANGQEKDNNGSCPACHPTCATCGTGKPQECKTCFSGYYFDATNKACRKCSENSADGKITGVDNCISCDPPSGNQGSVTCYVKTSGGGSGDNSTGSDPKLSSGAIAGISVAAVVVVGGLVGFLCWWFICRGKA